MRRIILDTSFILTAVRQKIDFFSWMRSEGFEILIPKGVLRELKGLGASLALKILETKKFRTLELEGRSVDNTIIEFARKNPRAIVATLDAGMKKKIKNPKLVIRQKRRLEIL